MTKLLDFQHILQRSKEDPTFFPKYVLGSQLWGRQNEILQSIKKNRRTTVKSCNASGKSFLAAQAALWFLYTHPDSIVLTTAPTYKQVANVLWREIRGGHERSLFPLGGDVLVDGINLDPNWYAKGFSTKDPENARGWHSLSGHMLVIVDEASGVTPGILDALEGAMTSPKVRILYIGNPTISAGRFYDSFQSDIWHKISISAFDTPNFTSNGIQSVEDLRHMTHDEVSILPLPYDMLVSPVWVWEKLQDWGENSPMFKSLVMAEFPSKSPDAIFDLNMIMKAYNLNYTTDHEKTTMRSIGIDVARGGADMTVLTPLVQSKEGVQQLEGASKQGNSILETVGMALQLAKKIWFNKARDVFVVDDIGVGGGVTDVLIQKGYRVIPFKGSGQGDEYSHNLRATSAFDFQIAVENEEVGLLDWEKQTNHLMSLKQKVSHSGKRILLSKDDMKKKGFDSPDYADAIIMAWHGIKRAVSSTYTPTKDYDTITAGILDQQF